MSSKLTNEYRPWENQGMSEADYFKLRYLEAQAEIMALQRHCHCMKCCEDLGCHPGEIKNAKPE
jgi:hypothetical protein